MSDPYAILGVARHATPEELKRAFRRQAKDHHPDLHPGTGAVMAMTEINRAYELLADPGKRAAWDAAHPVPVQAPARPRPERARPGSRADARPGPCPADAPRSAAGGSCASPGTATLDDALAHVLVFGKHRGRTLGYVAAVEPGYIAWLARTVTNRPEVVVRARLILAHLEAKGWHDTPRPPRPRPAPTARPGRTSSTAWEPSRPHPTQPPPSTRSSRDAAERVVAAAMLLLLGLGLLQGVFRGQQPGDTVCDVFDPRTGDCLVEHVVGDD